MKAYGYSRVSGKGQLQGDGFLRQEQAIKELAIAEGFEIVKIYEEKAISGAKDSDERPAFLEMLSDCLNQEINVIIVEKLDRLARSYFIQEQLLLILAAKGIALFAANTGENITDAMMQDPMKRAMVQIQGVIAELDKNMTVQRLKVARERKKAQTGMKCEGAKSWEETDPSGRVEVLEIINKMRKVQRNGRGKAATYKEIADFLNSKGFRTFRGKKWSLQLVRVEHLKNKSK